MKRLAVTLSSTTLLGDLLRSWTTGSKLDQVGLRLLRFKFDPQLYRLGLKQGQPVFRVLFLPNVTPESVFKIKLKPVNKITSYAASKRGLQNFIKDAFGASIKPHVKIGVSVILTESLDLSRVVAYLPPLIKSLSSDQLRIEDGAGFSLRDYLYQDEVLLRSAPLKLDPRNCRVFETFDASRPQGKRFLPFKG